MFVFIIKIFSKINYLYINVSIENTFEIYVSIFILEKTQLKNDFSKKLLIFRKNDEKMMCNVFSVKFSLRN